MNYICDIILLSYESPELLKECVESVLKNTNVKSRLIIVDNASKNELVRQYLQGLKGNDTVAVEKVFSERNEGFAAGMNKGMRLSAAPFVCLLNNDCVVTKGWLEELINIAEARPEIGLVNPQSNTFGSRPEEGMSIDKHAFMLSPLKGMYVELGHAIGFACLIKRCVIDDIGYLDEVFAGVCYEDTDYSLRALKAGYISVMSEGAYVFHHEQASRKSLKGKSGIYRKNRELFEARWGKLLRLMCLSGSEVRYGTLKRLARERAIIDVWLSESDAAFFTADVRHADIGISVVKKTSAASRSFWKVLTKKKPYNAVIVKSGLLAGFLRFAGLFRGTKVLTLESGGKLRASGGKVFDLSESAVLADFLRRKPIYE